MMRTYFTSNIPEAVIEAANMDGAAELQILAKIVLPMSIPIVATVTLLVGLAYWNDWINGLYYINKDTMFSIQSLLSRMLMDVQFLISNAQSSAAINQDIVLPSTAIKMAIAVMGALPILMVYPFFQKYFIKGIIIGAVKG
jgi:putative aldouronate transport system permease protein